MPADSDNTGQPHNDRCASLLGQGCDCRAPWDALGPPRERGVSGVVGEHDSPGMPPTSDSAGQQDRMRGSAAKVVRRAH